MAHFYLYVANIMFVLTLVALFTFLAVRMAARDGQELLGRSARSIGGGLVQGLLKAGAPQRLPEAYHLVVQETIEETGLEVGHIYPLQHAIVLIGRSDRNHIVLRDPLVSGTHAALSYERDSWWIEDRDSRNGTLLYPTEGSSKVVRDRPERVERGDVLQIGRTRLRLDS
jgi:hypothetical protein